MSQISQIPKLAITMAKANTYAVSSSQPSLQAEYLLFLSNLLQALSACKHFPQNNPSTTIFRKMHDVNYLSKISFYLAYQHNLQKRLYSLIPTFNTSCNRDSARLRRLKSVMRFGCTSTSIIFRGLITAYTAGWLNL